VVYRFTRSYDRRFISLSREAFPSSLAGLVPALLRLTSFELFACDKRDAYKRNWIAVLNDLSDLVGDCDSLRQFSCHMTFANSHIHAMCHLASRFPSLKRVQFLGTTRQDKTRVSASILDMVRTSQSIEAVDGWPFCNKRQNAAFRAKCRTNRIQNFWKFCRDNGVLTDRIPTSLWPLILHKYSDEVQPDIIFYLLQEMHATIRLIRRSLRNHFNHVVQWLSQRYDEAHMKQQFHDWRRRGSIGIAPYSDFT
jgi:hypothetical protein